jgi:NAD(P)-dependent dehydrogenase (short-subunit alcohol dehydrogenase family)
VEEDGGTTSTHSTDICDEEGVIRVIDAILERHGQIDGLVNNADGHYKANLDTISTKGFEAVVRSNLTGGFIVMRETYNRWMKANGGAIVNMIADIAGGWPGFGHSAASRGGMLTLTETAATEWAASGVRVNAAAPGSIASNGFGTYDDEHTSFIRNKVWKGRESHSALRNRVRSTCRDCVPARTRRQALQPGRPSEWMAAHQTHARAGGVSRRTSTTSRSTVSIGRSPRTS